MSDEEQDSYDGDGLNWREGIELRANSTYQALKEAFGASDPYDAYFDDLYKAAERFIRMVEQA